MKEKGFINKKTILLAVMLVAFLAFAGFIVSSWQMAEEDTLVQQSLGRQKKPAPRAEGAGGSFSGPGPAAPSRAPAPPVSGAQKMVAENPSEAVDPRLANITVTEISAYDPKDFETTPEQERIKKTISIATKPLRSAMGELPSFRYKGKMDVTVPTMAESEEAYNAGQRYGKGIQVTSSFVIEKAEDGSYHVHQEAQTATGETKYDGPEYNGDLYYKEGEFVYIGLDGKKADDALLSRILTNQEASKLEPLVRRNFIQILNELDDVVGFDDAGAPAGSTGYDIKAINPEMQETTVKLSELSGQLSILDETETMNKVDIKGVGELRSGYMSGATVSYDIQMEISDVGGISTINMPSQ